MLRSIRRALAASSLALMTFAAPSTHAVTWDLVRPSNTGIPGEEMRFIRFTPDGRMYVASRWYFFQEGGIGIHDRATDTWTTWSDRDTPLPSEYVNDLVFAPNGDTWISTDRGLVRKRGDQWTVFTTGNSPLHTNEVKELALDPDGHLWLNNSAVAGGMAAIFEYNGAQWREFRVGRELPWAAPWYGLSDVIVDHLGHVWVSNAVLNGLAEYNGGTWTLHGPGVDRFDKLMEDASGNIWGLAGIGGVSGSFYRFNRASFTRFDCTGTPINCTDVTAMALDEDGSIYVGDWSGRVIRTTNGGTSWSLFGAVNNFVTCITPDPISADVWVTTRDNVFQKNGSGATVRGLNHYNTGMPDWFIDNIHVDRGGSLWMASGEAGASRFDGARWRNWGAHNLGSEPWPFLAESASGLYMDSYGDMWIGSNGVGRIPPSLTGIEFWDWRSTPSFGVTLFDWFAEDRHRTLFAVDESGNTFRFNRAARTWSREPLSMYAPYGASVAVDAEQNLWVAEWFELDRWDGSAWTTVGTDWGLFDLGGINCIAFGRDGTLWIGTAEGLLRVREGVRTLYTPANSPLPASHIVSIAFRGDGLMALTAHDFGPVTPFPNGVCLINGSIDVPVNWTVYSYGTSPLPHYQLGPVAFDARGDLWVSAISGEACAVIRFDGTTAVAGGIPAATTRDRESRLPASPNPFHPSTTLTFALEADAREVSLVVFDVEGRRVRTVVDGPRAAGVHQVEWDGRDDAGRPLPPGVFFARFEAGDSIRMARLVLTR